MNLRTILGAAMAAFLWVSPASAVIIDLGTIGAGDTTSSNGFDGSDLNAIDEFHFNITSTFNFTGSLPLIDLTVVNLLSLVNLDTATTLTSGAPTSISFSPISPGNYSFNVDREFDSNTPESALIGILINLVPTAVVTPMPEPATALMFALGLGGLAAVRRRRRTI